MGTSTTLSGDAPRGAIIYTLGVTYDGSNQSSLATLSGNLTISGADITTQDLRIGGAVGVLGANATLNRSRVLGGINYNSTGTVGKSLNNCVISRASSFVITYGAGDQGDINNCLMFGTTGTGVITGGGGGQNLRRNFSFNNGNNDYQGETDSFITNASEDLTGSVGWRGYTSAELVNFAGDDFRTKSTSDLADDGAGGFIGAFLEAGGGNDVILGVDNGTFALSGSDVLFMSARVEQSLNGNYNLSGSNINFSIGYAINLDGGIYSLSGSATGLVLNANTVIESGEYSLAGTQVNLDLARKSIIESGSYNLTGSDVTLVYTPGGVGESLFIDSGAFSLTGSDIGLKSTRLISVNSGSYNLTGQQISLTYNAKTIIDSGSYALIGSNVNLFANRVIIAVNESYTLSGTSVILKYSGDTYKTIGTVTAGFAQDRYSAEYKPTTITVNFKD